MRPDGPSEHGDQARMSPAEVLTCSRRFARPAFVQPWAVIAVDALLRRQTRPHHDLDPAVAADELEPTLDALRALGYGELLAHRPARVVASSPAARSTYTPSDRDRHDVAALAARSGLELPPPYR